MSRQTKGSFVPLNWGTIVINGYVTENIGDDQTTGEHLIEDEGGDVVTQITKFGLKNDVNIEVIPATATALPEAGDIFAYGSKKLTIISISSKRVKKDVEKWTIKGNNFAGVPLDS